VGENLKKEKEKITAIPSTPVCLSLRLIKGGHPRIDILTWLFWVCLAAESCSSFLHHPGLCEKLTATMRKWRSNKFITL